jgi:hypothetical protein
MVLACALTILAWNVPGSGSAQQCSDSSACTVGDECRAGNCEGQPVTCPDDGDACTVEFCNPSNGECESVTLDCDDNDPCTTDSCDSATGCSNTPVPDSPATNCDDDNECTINDVCTGGVCGGASSTAPCDDENDCTDGDACSGGACSGSPVTNGEPCEADGSLCTQNDSCLAGFCVPGAPVICPPSGDPCMPSSCRADTGVCDPLDLNAACEGLAGPCGGFSCAGGTCVPSNDMDGEPCDDGNECTINDQCQAAMCGGDPVGGLGTAAPAMSQASLALLALGLALFAVVRLRRPRACGVDRC